MNVDKAKKRITKYLNRGFKGYPLISIEYFGENPELATEVVIRFMLTAEAEPDVQKLTANNDVRSDESIQTVLLKIIERANVNSVTEVKGVTTI